MRNAGLARWTFCKLETAFYLTVLRGERGCDERARGELLHGVFNVVWLPGVARLHGGPGLAHPDRELSHVSLCC